MTFPPSSSDQRAAVQADWDAAQAAHGRPASAGLVPSINNGKIALTLAGVGEVQVIDKQQARYARLRRNLGVAAKLLSGGPGVAYMLTLTYSDAVEWSPGHVKEAIRHLRLWLARAHDWNLRYLWVIETKARASGARLGEMRPHYHCVVWAPTGLPLADLMLDQRGWWPHGWTNVVRAKAPIRYVLKYVSKFEEPDAFPKNARAYGIGGMPKEGRLCRRWINWPKFVQARASICCPWRRARGGGWVDPQGEIWPSEYGLHRSNRLLSLLVRLRTYPTPIHAGREFKPDGPFNWLPSTAGAMQ